MGLDFLSLISFPTRHRKYVKETLTTSLMQQLIDICKRKAKSGT